MGNAVNKACLAAVNLLGLAACASGGVVRSGPADVLGGAAGDLRLLLDNRCAAAVQPFSEKSVGDRSSGLAGVAQQLLTSIGGVAFQSFGTYLKHAGEPNVTRSVGANGGTFYVAANSRSEMAIAPTMRCLYLVRNGFSSGTAKWAASVPADLQSRWRTLGVTRPPDLFAELHIETAAEATQVASASGSFKALDLDTASLESAAVHMNGAPPFFRVRLDRLYVQDFQNPNVAGASRDLAIVLNYGLASSQVAVEAAGANAGVTELTGKFAIGGIRFAGVHKGDFGPAELVSLQTGWMVMPPSRPFDPHATVDISAYVVEFAPGNKLLEEIGSYLASDEALAVVKPRASN
jgi:hypothetical protein